MPTKTVKLFVLVHECVYFVRQLNSQDHSISCEIMQLEKLIAMLQAWTVSYSVLLGVMQLFIQKQQWQLLKLG